MVRAISGKECVGEGADGVQEQGTMSRAARRCTAIPGGAEDLTLLSGAQ